MDTNLDSQRLKSAKILLLTAGILYFFYGIFILISLSPLVNQGINFGDILKVGFGNIVLGIVMISVYNSKKSYLWLGPVALALNIFLIIVLSVIWTFYWQFLIGICLSGLYTVGKILRKKAINSISDIPPQEKSQGQSQ